MHLPANVMAITALTVSQTGARAIAADLPCEPFAGRDIVEGWCAECPDLATNGADA